MKGHSGNRGNEEADCLASAGTEKPATLTEDNLAPPPGKKKTGAALASLSQKDFYKIIRDRRKVPTRKHAGNNVANIQEGAKETFGVKPTRERVWLATKHKDLTRKTHDFLWKSTQNAYKVGNYWTRIEGYQERGVCPICNEVEDMAHILTTCSVGTQAKTWQLANETWAKRHGTELPNTLGGILGCGLAAFSTGGKPDRGKNRLYRILMSEAAYLIWKLRNERRIRDNEGQVQMDKEVTTRWTNTLNKRLTMDRMLTNEARFQKNALEASTVKGTWRGCLRNEAELPADWPKARGVLVGILVARPPGRIS